MRVVRDITHPSCKITIFSWNGKYLIKLEQGDIEQTYKVDEADVLDENDLDTIIKNKDFMDAALKRFRDMHNDLADATNHLL